MKLTHYIFLPCLAFSSLHRHNFDLAEIMRIAMAVMILVSLLMFIAILVMREKFPGCSRNVLATVYMSSGTLLPPLAYVLFGNEGLAKAIYFHLFIILAYYTVGLWVVDGRTSLKKIIKTPFIYLIIIGVIVSVTPLSMPESIEEFAWLLEKGVDLTAMGALPLLLISFGYPLGRLQLSHAREGLKGGLLRIVAGPVVALLVIYIYRKTGFISMEKGYDALGYIDQRTTEAVLVLGAAMPTSNYALRLVGDEVKAEKSESGTVLVSAVIGCITVPIVLLLIMMFIFTD